MYWDDTHGASMAIFKFQLLSKDEQKNAIFWPSQKVPFLASLSPSRASIELAALFQVRKKNHAPSPKKGHIHPKFHGESDFGGFGALRRAPKKCTPKNCQKWPFLGVFD